MENFITVWQNLPARIDPVAFSLGGFEIRWYGLMYIAAFLCAYLVARWRIKNEKEFLKYHPDFITDLFTWMILGLLIGARTGYIVFYNFEYFLSNPLETFLPFTFGPRGFEFTGISGMSYHGGVIGVLLAGWTYVRIKKEHFWELVDLVIPGIPLGYTFGRIGNFLNGELWGRTTESAIGMNFPRAEKPAEVTEVILRHPSQLYEAFFEGIILFVLLWSLRGITKKYFPEGSMLPLYLSGYGIFRFIIEYFREPDAHLGFVFLEFSMGQILCFGMIVLAVIITFGLKVRHAKN